MKLFTPILGLSLFISLVAFASDYDTYKKNLAACTPFTFSYPHPIVKGFIAKKIIKGKVLGKCEAEELMPNNMKMECKFSDSCVAAISAASNPPSQAAQKGLSDECSTNP